MTRTVPMAQPMRQPMGQPPERPARPSPDDWVVCRDVTRSHGVTFHFASRLLAPHERRAIHAIYAWCRNADEIADTTPHTNVGAAHTALDAWLASIEAPTCPVSRAFAWVMDTWDIPMQPARDLVAGVRVDLEPARFATWEDLRWYGYCVAGTVGLLTAPVLGCRRDDALPRAVDLGVAMQLTNILRDVAEDARSGRLYLPLEDLERFGVSPESVLALRPDGDFRALMRFEIARARHLYQQARPGIPALSPAGQLATLSGSLLYSKILQRIEARDYDVFEERARVSTPAKVRAMPVVLASFLRMQVQRPQF